MEGIIFISEEQREGLHKAYSLIERIFSAITIDHEEYAIINTTLDSLKRAIQYKEKYY